MKAILVMEMPERCSKCPCSDGVVGECWVRSAEERIHDEEIFDPYPGEPGRCPLVPMPQRDMAGFGGDYDAGAKNGWNACLDAIEGSKG